MALFTPERIKRGLAAHVALMKHKAMHRLELKTDRLDFMTRMAAPDNGLTAEEFIASADTILLGGSETTATLLSGITYFLLKHPRVHKKLVNEIRTKFTSEDQIDMASVNSLDYMLACLNETFRLYPPVPGALPRRTNVGEALAGTYVPPNVSVLTTGFIPSVQLTQCRQRWQFIIGRCIELASTSLGPWNFCLKDG
jgi:cytochrome P450